MKKAVGSGVGSGSGSISQRYESGDPDPHQNVTDPQHCCQRTSNSGLPDHLFTWYYVCSDPETFYADPNP